MTAATRIRPWAGFFLPFLLLALVTVAPAWAQGVPPPPGGAGGSAGVTFITMLAALESQYPSFYKGLRAFCWVVGFLMAAWSIKRLKDLGDMRSHEQNTALRASLTSFFVAICLVQLPWFLGVLSNTFLLTETNLFDYDRQAGMQETAGSTLGPVVHFINFVGFLATIWGFFLLRRWGQYGGHDKGMQQAIVYILSGVAAMNIISVLKIIAATFDSKPMLDLVQRISS